MQKVGPYRYQVSAGEEITIAVTPVRVGPRVVVNDSESGTVPNSGTENAPLFRFAAGPVGTCHYAEVACTFVDADDPQARFELAIFGDPGAFSDSPIERSDWNHSPIIEFEVVRASRNP